jgi:hypothetical protein
MATSIESLLGYADGRRARQPGQPPESCHPLARVPGTFGCVDGCGAACSAVSAERPIGVVVADIGGVRSTSALGRALVADALRGVDPVGSRAAGSATVWRRDYVLHFRRLVEAGLLSRDAALKIARDGLASLHGRMRFATRRSRPAGRARR